ncbi:hypothetical protein T439DRAFT_323536 [Meredithblackwellia eburnea MCA 4105]
MIEDRIRLLEHLVYSNYGSAVGEIASLLLHRGSLPFSHLVRLSSLPPPLVHSSILILSLHGLLYHSESEIGGRLTDLYEINPTAIENRLRGGLYIHLAEEVGDGLDFAVEALWRNGMLKADEIAEEVALKYWGRGSGTGPGYDALKAAAAAAAAGSSKSSKAKGKAKAKDVGPSTMSSAKAAAKKMVARGVRDGFLSIVTPGSQISPMSLEIKWEEELRLAIKGLPTAKDLNQVKATLREKKAEWDEEERERAQGRGFGQEKKKKSRHRGIDMDLETQEEVLPTLPKDAFFRINVERFHVRWRSQLIHEYGKERFNHQVADVLKAILSIAEKEVESIHEDVSRSVTINEIYQAVTGFESQPDLLNCFPDRAPNEGWRPPKIPVEAVGEICRVLGCDDEWDSPKAFLKAAGGGDSVMAKWVVKFHGLEALMKRALVEALIQDKEGLEAVRCWRILDAKGKLEEKHLARLAFLPVKDAREVLGRLSASALIEQQEVPRSADRAPSRTFFLWYVDYNKVVASLLDHLYKALANLQAQRQHQLATNHGLVEKRERSDVREDPNRYLTSADKHNAKRLDEKLEAITTAEMRIDRDIFVLRDLDPVDRRVYIG